MSGTRVYPWHQLKVPGDSFTWTVMRDEGSLRAQASKQGKKRSIEISVRIVNSALVVTYVRGII